MEQLPDPMVTIREGITSALDEVRDARGTETRQESITSAIAIAGGKQLFRLLLAPYILDVIAEAGLHDDYRK